MASAVIASSSAALRNLVFVGPSAARRLAASLRPTTAWRGHATSTARAAVDYTGMTVAKLKKELTDRGLPTTGNKLVLIERLEENDGKTPEGEAKAAVEEVQAAATAPKAKPKAKPEGGLAIKKGDWVEAKPGQRMHQHNALYYDEGYKGVVTNVFDEEVEEGVNETFVQVTWNASQLVTHYTLDEWEEVVAVIEKDFPEEEEEDEDLPYGRRKWGDDNDFIGLGPGSPTWDPKKLQYFVGDMVECRRNGKWTTARLAKNHANWSYNVKWDTDAVEEMVKYDDLRKPRQDAPMPAWVEDWWPME